MSIMIIFLAIISMNHSEASAFTTKYNYDHHDFSIRFISIIIFMTGIPITMILFVIKDDVERHRFVNFNDAVAYRENIVKNMSLKT